MMRKFGSCVGAVVGPSVGFGIAVGVFGGVAVSVGSGVELGADVDKGAAVAGGMLTSAVRTLRDAGVLNLTVKLTIASIIATMGAAMNRLICTVPHFYPDPPKSTMVSLPSSIVTRSSNG